TARVRQVPLAVAAEDGDVLGAAADRGDIPVPVVVEVGAGDERDRLLAAVVLDRREPLLDAPLQRAEVAPAVEVDAAPAPGEALAAEAAAAVDVGLVAVHVAVGAGRGEAEAEHAELRRAVEGVG